MAPEHCPESLGSGSNDENDTLWSSRVGDQLVDQPGVLDWILYTDSVLDLHNHFIVETRTMTSANLAAQGLFADDTFDASDHAMVVADFSIFNPLSPVPGAGNKVNGAHLLPNAPNPFNPSTQLRFELEAGGVVDLAVFDARGRLIKRFAPADYQAGIHAVSWDGRDEAGRPAASGAYQVRLTVRNGAGESVARRAITLLE